ncbi:hypothetical protein [Limnohabitans sp.]|jgi:hypothetical protein|uniref:hypothetical protein n=1 Tax=Limnohabitans sp. TaxID=1907725 RepID=UPI00333E8545
MSDEKLNANTTLDKVLGYVDSPFKLFAIILMGVIAFAGYFLWQNQTFMLDAYKESKKLPEINASRADDVGSMLMKKTGATVVAVFRVNPLFNSRTVYRAYTKDGRDKSIEDIDVGLFSQNSANNSDVVKLMTNEIPCGEYRYAQSEVGLWYLEKGVAYTCRISVPPDSHRFVGQITVGWTEPPQDIQQVRFMLEIASAMLTKRGN